MELLPGAVRWRVGGSPRQTVDLSPYTSENDSVFLSYIGRFRARKHVLTLGAIQQIAPHSAWVFTNLFAEGIHSLNQVFEVENGPL